MTISLKAALVECAKKAGRERGQRLADSSDGWALRNLSWKERRVGSELEYALAEVRKLRGAPSDPAAQQALAQILEDASEERYEEIRRQPVQQRVHEHLERTRGPFNPTSIWLIVSDGRCDTSHGYSAASADEAVSIWRKATGSAADANAIPKEGRFALVQERGGMYSLANTKLKLDVAVRRYWEDNQRQPGMYVIATGANGSSAGGTGLVWETTFRPVEPDWFILTIHKDIAMDLGEGPFDSEEQAREFAEAEVGATWVLFQAPPGTVPALEKDRERDYGKPVEKRLNPRPEPGNWYVLGVDQERVAHVSKGPWETPRKAGRYRSGSEVFFRAPHRTREAFDGIQWKTGGVQPKRDALLQKLIAGAAAHGRESEPDHEIGDLEGFIRTAFETLSPPKQRAFYEEQVPKESAAAHAKGDRIFKILAHVQDREPAREVSNLHRILEACWALLTREQRRDVYGEFKEDVEEWLSGTDGETEPRVAEPSAEATMEATVVRLNVGGVEAARVLIITSDALLRLSVRGTIAKHLDSLGEAVVGPAVGDGLSPRPVEALSLRVVYGKRDHVRFYVLGKDPALREEIADYIASQIKPGPGGKLERGNAVVTVGGPA